MILKERRRSHSPLSPFVVPPEEFSNAAIQSFEEFRGIFEIEFEQAQTGH